MPFKDKLKALEHSRIRAARYKERHPERVRAQQNGYSNSTHGKGVRRAWALAHRDNCAENGCNNPGTRSKYCSEHSKKALFKDLSSYGRIRAYFYRHKIRMMDVSRDYVKVVILLHNAIDEVKGEL